MKESITETGVKDSLAGSVAQNAIVVGRELRTNRVGRSMMREEDIGRTLDSMVDEEISGGAINPLLDLPGLCSFVTGVVA